MKTKILPVVIALFCISTHAFGDEVDDRFQKARKYLSTPPDMVVSCQGGKSLPIHFQK
jgi:hypothetical protein